MKRWRRLGFVASPILAAILAGWLAAASGSALAERLNDPSAVRLALRAGDLPAGFQKTEAHYLSDVQSALLPAPTSPSQQRRWHRVEGYVVAFQRRSSGGVVASIRNAINVYRDAAGARAALTANGQCRRVSLHRVSLATPPGQHAAACESAASATGSPDTYLVIWVRGRTEASLQLIGFAKTAPDPKMGVALARKIDHRINAAPTR
jgi:hypothetical protein